MSDDKRLDELEKTVSQLVRDDEASYGMMRRGRKKRR